jgi:hypothetical protein
MTSHREHGDAVGAIEVRVIDERHRHTRGRKSRRDRRAQLVGEEPDDDVNVRDPRAREGCDRALQ